MRFDAEAFLVGLFTQSAESGAAASKENKAGGDSTINAEGLPPDWHFAWDERAAILEFDAGFPRERAEALALADVLEQMRRVGTIGRNDTCS